MDHNHKCGSQNKKNFPEENIIVYIDDLRKGIDFLNSTQKVLITRFFKCYAGLPQN